MNKTKNPHLSKKEKPLLARKKSYALALAIAGASTGQVYAQEGEEAAAEPASEAQSIEEVVVTGMRSSMQNAQELKRYAPTVIDSITAKDLGSFPDKSVAEALQRVPGVTVNRFAATSDTAHFSAEPSGVVVRGLNQVRTEFNGRDSFNANSSRGLSWGDISPELMSGVDTYKNQMAELIEGGIAGSVNMRTRVPFDQDGEMFALSLSANYGDLSKKTTPEGSALYSNRWETEIGEFGFLANYAHSEVKTRSMGNQLYRANRFNNVYGDTDNDGSVDQDMNGDGVVDAGDSLLYIPAKVMMRDNLYERERDGASIAFQFQNLDGSVVVTSQYNRTQYTNAWEEYVVSVAPADLSYGQSVFYEVPAGTATAPRPAEGTDDFVFDNDGLFQNGTTVTDIGWWGGDDAASATRAQNAAGDPLVSACYGWNGCSPAQRGVDMSTETRSAITDNMTQDLSLNVKWVISDTVRSNFDVQYIDASVDNYDISVGYGSFANTAIDLRGEHPKVELLDPTNVNLSEGNWANPNNYYTNYIMDHLEQSEGDQFSARFDFEFDIDKGPLMSIKVGARYADREQIIRNSAYNWENLANSWSDNQAHYFNVDQHEPTPGGTNGNQPGFTGYPDDYYVVRSFDNNYHNLNVNQLVFANAALLSDRQRMADSMSASALGLTGGVGWDNICSNTGDRAAEIPGTCTTPAELVDVAETTTAAYIQLEFGGDYNELFGLPYSGNIGVRWVKTEVSSQGGVDFPLLGPDRLACESKNDPETGLPAPVPMSLGCYLSADDIAYSTGTSRQESASKTHHHLLPSFNLKLDLTDEWIARFAYSKALSRPDMGNLRNYVSISTTLPDEENPQDPLWIKNEAGEIVGADVVYTAGAQNPELAPTTANQFDVALEYYFDDVGSFTVTAFYKEFDDYIQYGKEFIDYTANGVTKSVEVRRPINGDGAKLKGFEVAFQRFFNFLPEPWDGLGIQANYTYIKNNGITNSGVKNDVADSTTVTDQAPDQISVNRLEGLSDHTYNIVGMYEKYDWQARLAYTWRSEYMVTAIDCCVAYPIWNDDFGTLDGSITYAVNDNLDIKLQVNNILNTETYLEQQVDNHESGGKRMPNAWFQNDRRYTASVLFKF